MEPGERTTPVAVHQKTTTTGASRFPVDTWTPLLARVWMRKVELKLTEQFRAGQESAYAETRWEMGYRADMDPERIDVPTVRRLQYQDRIYDITGASVIGQREGIELLTLARTDAS